MYEYMQLNCILTENDYKIESIISIKYLLEKIVNVCKKEIDYYQIKNLDEFINLTDDVEYISKRDALNNELNFTIQAVANIENLSLQIN
jgi:carboxypeptidase C (cathepsin A)